MTTFKVQAQWLEMNDVILVNGQTFEIIAVDGFESLDIHMVDDEGYKKILTVPCDQEISVVALDTLAEL